MPWLPLVVVVLAQIVIAANLSTVNISIGAIVADFPTATTNVQSAVVICSLITAAMMILGGRASAAYGALPMFRGGVLLLGVAMAGVALSRGAVTLILAEGVAGAATAALAPTLVALVTANYQGRQQALAIGAVGVAGGAISLVIAGVLGSLLGWRVPFWILVGVAALVVVMSRRVAPSSRETGVTINWFGVLLSATGIVLLTVGINGIGPWGLLSAKDSAPFDLFGLSPAPFLIAAGALLVWGFFRHQRRRTQKGRTPLLSPEVVQSPAARRAIVALLAILLVSGGTWYLIPLYMQVVQGFDGSDTAVRMLPYALAVSSSALLVTRLVGRFTAGSIARASMLLMTVGLLAVSAAIQNRWTNAVVICGLVILGLGQGAALTVVSNVLVGSSRRELGGEVGGLRGSVCSLGQAIGTAMAGALLILLLSSQVGSEVASSKVLPANLKNSAKLESVQFISNQQLEHAARGAGLTEAQVKEAVRINTEERLTALRRVFLALAAMAAVGMIMAGGLRAAPDPGTAQRQRPRPAARRRIRRTHARHTEPRSSSRPANHRFRAGR